ncbi:MAG: membrane-associated protein, partial [Verrucomicrobia bacterium]
STMAISVVFFEALWNADFFSRLLTGKSLIGLSAYMFDPKIPLLIRGLSCFHIVLPLLLLWTVHRLGYDQRAFVWQTVVALVVLPISYLVSNPQENVNWVYGFGQKPQTILPAPLFVILLMLLFPLAIYLPTHLLFARIFRAAAA